MNYREIIGIAQESQEKISRRRHSLRKSDVQSRRTFRPLHLEGRKLYQETRQLSCREEKSCSAKARNTRHATNRNPIIRAIRNDRLAKSPGITFARASPANSVHQTKTINHRSFRGREYCRTRISKKVDKNFNLKKLFILVFAKSTGELDIIEMYYTISLSHTLSW